MRGIGTQSAADLDAVESRHHHVEQDEIGQLLAHHGKRLRAAARGHDLIAVGGEPRPHDIHVRRNVVDDEDARGSTHGPGT